MPLTYLDIPPVIRLGTMRLAGAVLPSFNYWSALSPSTVYHGRINISGTGSNSPSSQMMTSENLFLIFPEGELDGKPAHLLSQWTNDKGKFALVDFIYHEYGHGEFIIGKGGQSWMGKGVRKADGTLDLILMRDVESDNKVRSDCVRMTRQ